MNSTFLQNISLLKPYVESDRWIRESLIFKYNKDNNTNKSNNNINTVNVRDSTTMIGIYNIAGFYFKTIINNIL